MTDALEEIEKLVSPELLRQCAIEVDCRRSGGANVHCPQCDSILEFVSEGTSARWSCVGKPTHRGGAVELVMIAKGFSEPDARALMAFRVGLANYPAGLVWPKAESSSPRPTKRTQPPSPTRTIKRGRPTGHRAVALDQLPAAATPKVEPSLAPGGLDELTSALRGLVTTLGAQTAAPLEPLWGVADLAKFLNVTKSSVYALVAAGHVPAVRIGRLLRFVPEEIRRWLSAKSKANTKRRMPI